MVNRMTSTEFSQLATVLNKLLAALGAGPMPEGTNETNVIQTLGVIASSAEDGNQQQTSVDGTPPKHPDFVSDYAMANKIARRQDVPFSQIWKSMPKSGVKLTLTGRRKAFGFFR